MKKLIVASISLLALATVYALSPAQLNSQSVVACPGCTNLVSMTLVECTNGVVACPGCTNGVTLAMAGF